MKGEWRDVSIQYNVCSLMESWVSKTTKKQPKPATYNGCFGKNWGLRLRAPGLSRTPSLLFSFLPTPILQGLTQTSLHCPFPSVLPYWPLRPLPLLPTSTELSLHTCLSHSIPDHGSCFICAHVCKWKLVEARGPGFWATPSNTSNK